MTDATILKEMLTRAKIEYKETTNIDPPVQTEVAVYGGYVGFFTVFQFDTDGKLLTVEAFE